MVDSIIPWNTTKIKMSLSIMNFVCQTNTRRTYLFSIIQTKLFRMQTLWIYGEFIALLSSGKIYFNAYQSEWFRMIYFKFYHVNHVLLHNATQRDEPTSITRMKNPLYKFIAFCIILNNSRCFGLIFELKLVIYGFHDSESLEIGK